MFFSNHFIPVNFLQDSLAQSTLISRAGPVVSQPHSVTRTSPVLVIRTHFGCLKKKKSSLKPASCQEICSRKERTHLFCLFPSLFFSSLLLMSPGLWEKGELDKKEQSLTHESCSYPSASASCGAIWRSCMGNSMFHVP